jgi:hypothetical protein
MMRRQFTIFAKVGLSGIGLAMVFGCGAKTLPPPPPGTASVDQQIQKVEARTDLSDDQKAHIVAMLKSTPAPSSTQSASK